MTTRVAIVGGTGKLGGIIRDVVDDDRRLRGRRDAVLALRALGAGRRRPRRRRLDPGRLDRRRAGGDRTGHQRPGRHLRLVGRAHRARAAARGGRRHRRRVHPQLLARLGARLGPRRRRGAVLPVDRDRRGAPRDEGRFAERHRRAHGRAHRGRARRGRPGRVAARRSARPRPAGRERADPLAAPPRRRRPAGGRSCPGPGESLTHRSTTPSSPRWPMPPASASPSRPRATRAA